MKTMFLIVKCANDLEEGATFTATPEEFATLVNREGADYTFDIGTTLTDRVLNTVWFSVTMHRVPVQVIG